MTTPEVPIDRRHAVFALCDFDNQPDVVARAKGNITELESTLQQLHRLNLRLEEQNRQLTALYEIGRTLASTLDLREIYWTMYRQIAQGVLGASVLFVALYDQVEQIICGSFAVVDGEELDATEFPRIPLGDGPVSDTIRSRTARIVDLRDLSRDLQSRGRGVLVGDGLHPKTALYVPLVGGDRVVGVMQIQHYEEGAFRETDLTLVTILANQAAIALENAQLFKQVQRHNVELEQRVAERTRDLAEANERLKELDRLKDQFISNVSHELRTPLANVKLYLQLLARGRPEKHDEYMGTLQREALRLEHLIEDLLDLSRLDMRAMPFQLEPTDINSLIVQFIHDRAAMAADRGLKLDSQLAADLPPVMVDTQRFAQVMSNLTTNALYYTPVGGTVTLCTAARQDENLDWVAFTVRDTGHGIAEQELSRLFERFFRGEASRKSAAPGTGLGLSICKAIAESMGGHITVENQPGGGAAFTVWLKPFDCQSSTSDLLAK